MIAFKPGAADVFAGEETEEAEEVEPLQLGPLLSLLNERFSTSLCLLDVGMQAPSSLSSSSTLQLLPVDAFEVHASSIANAGNGLFSRVPIALGRYTIAFTGKVYEQPMADGLRSSGWYGWLQSAQAKAAAAPLHRAPPMLSCGLTVRAALLSDPPGRVVAGWPS